MSNQVSINQGIVRILEDSVLDTYNESIKEYNERARESLGQFGRKDGELTGSSPLMIIQLVNSGALPEGTRLAKIDDLADAISKDNSFLRRNYSDFALALRTAGDSYSLNDLLAKRLAKQLEQRDIPLNNGKLIPLDVLSLIEDENSAYGIVINLKEEVESSIRDINDFEWDYTRDEGLSCAVLDSYRNWNSDFVRLACSSGVGRVVVVSAEGTTKNLRGLNILKEIN